MTPHIAALLFLAGSLVYLGIRYCYQRQQRSREKETDRASLTDRVMVVAVGALYLARVPNEERMMAERLGEAYRAYMARSGGLLPRHGW